MGGIILGALGGLGQGMSNVGAQMQKSSDEQELENIRSENAYNKAIALQRNEIQMKSDAEDAARKKMVSDIDAAKTGIINQRLNDQFGNAKPADPSTWTPEQQAVVDQAKAARKTELQNDDSVDTDAAWKSGYLKPSEYATINRGDRSAQQAATRDAQRFEIELGNLKLQGLRAEQQDRKIDALIDHWNRGDSVKEEKADAAGSGTGGAAGEKLHSLLTSVNKTMDSLIENKPRSKDPEVLANWQSQFDDAQAVRARVLKRINATIDSDDKPIRPANPATPSSATKPAGAASAPAASNSSGWKLIGSK